MRVGISSFFSHATGVVYQHLSEEIRIERDFKNEKLGHKIREAQMQKIPYMLVIGDKEVESRGISPRQRDGKNLGMMNPEQFVAMVRAKVSKYE